ncbi:MAG: DUF4350 domain-containing protein [Myxococcales bacterium]
MTRRSWALLLLFASTLFALPGVARAADDEPAASDNALESRQQSLPASDTSSPKPASDDDPQEAKDESETTDEDQPGDEEQTKGEAVAEATDPFQEVSKDDVERSLSGALSDPSASFCRAKELEPFGDAAACALSKVEVRQRCPGLQMACQIKDDPERHWHIPAWLGGLADLIFWAVLMVLFVTLAIALWRTLGSARLELQASKPVQNFASDEPARVVRRSGEGDVARLWAQAERAASASRFEEAVATLQAALIHALRISGKLHVSPALTNGDYLRALRPDPSLHGPVREVFRDVEAVQFGGAVANADLYRKLFERVQPIVTRALSAAVLLWLCLGQSSCGAGGLAGDFRGSANGLGVFTHMLKEQHTTVRRRVRAIDEIEPEVSAILVVGEQPSEVWSKLLEFTSDGGTLIVTGKSEDLEEATHTHYVPAGYSGKLGWLPVGFEPAQLELSAVAEHALELPPPARAHDRTFATAKAQPYVAERGYGAGRVLYFADEEFLSSASLSLGDNAFFVTSLLRRPGHVLELVGPWTGGGSKSTFSSLFKAGLGVLLAQLALLGVLFGWHGGVRFGLPRDPIAQKRRAFRDHVLALGESYRRARATRFALATYGSWLTDRLRDRLSPQQPIGLIDLAGRVATRVELPESELVLLLTEARDAQEDAAQAKPSAADLTSLEKLESVTLRAGGSK